MPETPHAPDAVTDLWTDSAPAIVSVSDVHGYLSEARSALTAVADTDAFPPVVTEDAGGRLRWAGNDYVLVVNGDLIDRGPENAAAVRTVDRLADEAPPGRVRYLLGNHEMAALLPTMLRWPRQYSGQLEPSRRREFYERIRSGTLAAAFEGYGYTYSHAGQPEAFDVAAANAALREAAERLLDALADGDYEGTQEAVAEEYDLLFGLGGRTGRGPGAGLAWLDFEHLPGSAPPQIVGHTKHARPTRTGNVVCENVIRRNRRRDGGEAVLVETPEDLLAVRRVQGGGVDVASLAE